MRISLAKPSLSRDFALLSGAIFLVLLMISCWVVYNTYVRHAAKIAFDLESEAERIDYALAIKMDNANYMLSSIGRQIVLKSTHDYTELAQSLKAFDSKDSIYSIFSWTTPDKKMVVSSNIGVLEVPLDISDRDFIQQASNDSWKIHIGKPIEGRVSSRWVIPVGMGVTDYTGKFIGIVSLSIDIKTLIAQIGEIVKRDGVSFSLVNKQLIPIAEVNSETAMSNVGISKLADVDLSVNQKGLFEEGSIVFGSGNYSYYKVSENHPYIIMVSYDTNYSDGDVRSTLFARLLQIFMLALFFMMFLWLVKSRVIRPVLAITESAHSIANGGKNIFFANNSSIEIDALAVQLLQIEKYISETKLIERELKNKILSLKKSKEDADIASRSKSEFLAYITQEIRLPLNNIIGFSQALKDQMYGPIDNKKYKQYSIDIFSTANQLMSKMQDVLQYSKLETGYVFLRESRVDLAEMISASMRQINERLTEHKTAINIAIAEDMPNLLVDEFRFQQIITNALLIMLDNIKEDGDIIVKANLVDEYRDKKFCVISVTQSGVSEYQQSIVLQLLDNLNSNSYKEHIIDTKIINNLDIKISLINWLVSAHGGVFDFRVNDDGSIRDMILLLPASRIVEDGVL